ncbi:GFA family protein [Nocardia amikacinitolerans]|uniref:GFA family protein n=1 Tax=Nocardia amikacinitolerans TaxID=756689 RepID=UPI000A06A9EE|nr:GFA family protein [Nocardia amikacinitolerans]
MRESQLARSLTSDVAASLHHASGLAVGCVTELPVPARCRDGEGCAEQRRYRRPDRAASNETAWCPTRRSDVNGGCLCGNIRFSATGDPDFPHLCSCEHCQRLSGGPVMSWVSFPEEGFAWTGPGGEPIWFETFPGIGRGFCPACGSSVASKGDEAGLVGVTITALDDHSDLVPVKQSFASNAVPWMAPLG